MRQVMIVTREDLSTEKKLEKVEDVEYAHLYCQATRYETADIVIFNCSLTGQSRVIKNRGGATTEAIDMSCPEGENMLLSFILGI